MPWEDDRWVERQDASSHVEVSYNIFPTMILFELLVFENDSAVSGARYYMVKTK